MQLSWRLAVVLWGIGTLGAWVWATNYEFSTVPENRSAIPQHWPIDSDLPRSADRPTLLFFMHPRCPCTSASVHELARMLTGSGLSEIQCPDLVVVAFGPDQPSAEWTESATLRQADELPRSKVFWDVDGVVSAQFGASTSGAVRLYGRDGKLLFSGGVTASRGHEGDNRGCEALRERLIDPTTSRPTSAPVFGCRIHNDAAPIVDGDSSAMISGVK
ncbi:hypothetical protein AB1L30_10050 [Bremerella sp. JC817]|uniref:hypothetical protein n=1 Tax=Bremerella sp. JC817 TaxID=3231756 RepID=UPI003457F1D2